MEKSVQDPLYDLVEVIKLSWIILYNLIVGIISPEQIIVTPKNFNGLGRIGNRVHSILSLRIHLFIKMHSQNSKTEDGEINIPENISDYRNSNGMFDERFTSKDLTET